MKTSVTIITVRHKQMGTYYLHTRKFYVIKTALKVTISQFFERSSKEVPTCL